MIFESPDGGKTVYSREAGQTARTLYSIDDDITDMFATLHEDTLWGNIRREAKKNIALQAVLDHAIMIYKLSKEYKDGL
jgi:hypothetical protein